MEIIFLLNGLLALIISIFLISHFIKKRNDNELKNFFFLFLLIGVIYLIFSIFSVLLSFNFLGHNADEFLLLYSFLIFFQTIILFNFFYKIKKNPKIFLLLLFYLGLISSYFLPVSFSYLLGLTSFLLTLMLFLLLISIPQFEKISGLGILYASISIIFQILVLFNTGSAVYYAFFSSLAFLLFITKLVRTFEISPKIFFSIQKPEQEQSFILDFLKYFVFIIILTNFLFIGTISLHEVGHLSSGKIAGCSFGKIIYEEGGLPHTEILCDNDGLSTQKFVLLGGIVLPVIVALLLVFAGGTFIKESALLLIGFNFMISYQDLFDFGFSRTIPLFFLIVGICLVLLGIFLLAKSRTTERRFISLG